MKVLILMVLIVKRSQKDKPCSVSFMLTLTWDIDIFIENVTPETGH